MILSSIILGESLAAGAMPTSIPKNEVTPNLFHIGQFNISIVVSKTAFSPNEFTVKESATVNVTIESIDIDHTFYIPEYELNETIAANTTYSFVFEADILGEFTFTSMNSTGEGTMIVTDPYVPDLPRPEDINIILDYSHHDNLTLMYEKYETIFNWSRNDNDFDLLINENTFLTDEIMKDLEVLILLEPNENLTVNEIPVIKKFLNNGGSLIIGGSPETAFTNVYEITEQFGFTFTNSSARYINATIVGSPVGETNTLGEFTVSDFADHPIISENQYVPLTDQIISKMKYTGTLLTFNATWAAERLVNNNLTDTGKIIDCYTLATGNETIFADANGDTIVSVNETIGAENTFIVAAESAYNSRVFAIGSADLFNETMIGRNPENLILYQRALQWVAKMYAILQSTEYTLGSYEVSRNDIINTSIIIKAQNNTVTDSITVSIRVWRSSRIEAEFVYTPINASYFEGQIDTTNITKGTVSIDAVAHKRGYGYNVTTPYYVEINPREPGEYYVAIPYIITYVITIIVGIGAMSLFFIRVLKTPKTVRESETTSTADDEIEEDEDTVDLDEYENEEESETPEEE